MKTPILAALLIALSGANFTAGAAEPSGTPNLRDKARSAEPAGTPNLRDKARPGDPCCNIAAINAKTGIVTARDTASGKTFKFTVNDKGMLKGLRAGDAVDANFAAGQVAIRKYGASPCCFIVP